MYLRRVAYFNSVLYGYTYDIYISQQYTLISMTYLEM